MPALVGDTLEVTATEVMAPEVTATVWVIIMAKMETTVNVAVATAPAGNKKQSSAAQRKKFIRSLSSSCGGEGSPFLYPKAVLLVHELDDLRYGEPFIQLGTDEPFLLHRSLGHVALALS